MGEARVRRELLRRRAHIIIGVEDLANLLQLPGHMDLMSLHASADPPAVRLIVVSPRLDPVDDNAESPQLQEGRWARMGAVVNGRVYTRWEWVGDDITSEDHLVQSAVDAERERIFHWMRSQPCPCTVDGQCVTARLAEAIRRGDDRG